MIYSDILKSMSNDELLEEHGLVSASHYENPDDIGFDSTKFEIEEEILRRMK